MATSRCGGKILVVSHYHSRQEVTVLLPVDYRPTCTWLRLCM